MDYFNWWPGPIPGETLGTMLAILCTGCLVTWRVNVLWTRNRVEIQGTLLLQMEVNDLTIAHIGMLTAEERHRQPTYRWSMSQINSDDFPHSQMTDLPFTHIIVTQKKDEKDLLTINVLDHAKGFLKADFYWIKDATIGNRPGFPRELLLPHNLVLKYYNTLEAS